MTSVTLAINCYERNYREVLTPEFIASVRDQQARPVEILVLVSNVLDHRDAADRAAGVRDAQVEWVSDHLAKALHQVHLTRRSFGVLLWYSAAPLVALTLRGPDWLVYWDSEITLSRPCNWIDPSIALMQSDPRVAVANPRWHVPGNVDTINHHVVERRGNFVLGTHTMSDQCFLVRRSEFGRPIYRHSHPEPWLFQTAPSGRLFEYRADAYLRRSGRLRATFIDVTYTHPAAGARYPTDRWTPLRARCLRARRKIDRLRRGQSE